MKNDLLYNFISPITGRFNLNTNYIFLGDSKSMSFESPKLIDIELDLIDIRHIYDNLCYSGFIVKYESSRLKNSQSLGNLQTGLLKNTVNNATGTLSTAIAGKDYVEVAAPIANMQLALIRPELIQEGQDVAKLLSRVERLPIGNMPNLTKGKYWKGGDNNIPIEVDLPNSAPSDATYVLNTPNNNLSNSQALSQIGGAGLLKLAFGANGIISLASAGTSVVFSDYVDPLSLQVYLKEQMFPYGALSVVNPWQTPGFDISAAFTLVNLEIANLTANFGKLFVYMGGEDSQITGSGRVTLSGQTEQFVSLNLKKELTIKANTSPDQYKDKYVNYQYMSFENANDKPSVFGLVHHTDTENILSYSFGIVDRERHISLLQPSGQYHTESGSLLETRLQNRKVLDISLNHLIYRDDAVYGHQADKIDNIFKFDVEKNVFSFNKNLIITNGIDEPDTLDGMLWINNNDKLLQYSINEQWYYGLISDNIIGTDNQIKIDEQGKNVKISLTDDVNIRDKLVVGGNVNFNSNDYMKIPVGTTEQRPINLIPGMIRFNTSL